MTGLPSRGDNNKNTRDATRRLGSGGLANVDHDITTVQVERNISGQETSLLSPIGGDVRGCLTSDEINHFLASDVDAALFFRWRNGQIDNDAVRQVINTAIGKAQTRGKCAINFVAHFRHHWVAMRFDTTKGERRIAVYDSAPSPMVRRDIARLCAAFGWPAATHVPCPRQTYGSEQCGIFAIAAVLRLAAGLAVPTHGTYDLDTLRPLLIASAERDTLHRQFLAKIAAIRPVEETVSGGQGDQTHCTARKQSKRGGGVCTEPVIAEGIPLCRLHYLLSQKSPGTCVTVTTKNQRCPHHRVAQLDVCAFHVSAPQWETILNNAIEQARALAARQLAQAEEQHHHEPEEAAAQHHEHDADPQGPQDPTATALQDVEDPDFEDNLLFITQRLNNPQPGLHPHNPLPNNATFGDLQKYVAQRGPTTHPLASLAWRKETLKGHKRAINGLNTPTTDGEVNKKISDLPMITGLIELFSQRRSRKTWKWSTTLRNMAAIQGALKNLPISHGIGPVDLALSAEWLAAIKGVGGMAKSERPKVPHEASANQILDAIRKESSRPVKLLTALTWLCCGRTGDCRQLESADIKFFDENGMTVTFRKGKTVARRGPYSLHTVFPPGWKDELNILDETFADELKNASVSSVLAALRRVEKSLENRSIRRGSLQALAKAGVPESTLLEFSGHTSIGMLRRYLAWGAVGTHKRETMKQAAAALVPTGGSESSPLPPKYNRNSTRFQPTNKPGHESSRWLQFLGAETPPMEELPLGNNFNQTAANNLPLASKNVAAKINVFAALNLTAPEELKALATEAFRWLHDPTLYEQLLASKQRPRRNSTKLAHLPDADVDLQIALKKYEVVTSIHDPMRAYCRVFTVAEWSKCRRRHIAEPLVNDLFELTNTIHFSTRQHRHELINKYNGGYAITMDFASYFDQFPLAESVRKFFGIRTKRGTCRMQVLPMGFRPAAQIAQCATWLMCSTATEDESITVLSYIDNILILAHSAAKAEEARQKIIAAATTVGALFNQEDIASPPSRTFEFLGEAFNLEGQAVTVSLSQKTLAKVKALKSVDFAQLRITKRQLAAVIGLCLFASGAGLIKNEIYQRFPILRFYGDQLKFTNGRGSTQWNELTTPMTKTALTSLHEWIEELYQNNPKPLTVPTATDPSDILFTDASADSWGAIHWRVNDGSIRTYSECWSNDDRAQWNLSSSVCSEPLGIAKAICRCIAPSASTHVLVYTDHDPVVTAVTSTCAKTWTYWLLQRTIRQFPVSITVRHIPGSINPADPLSRGNNNWDLLLDLLDEAKQYHRTQQQTTEDNGEHGAEWRLTARNPLRPL